MIYLNLYSKSCETVFLFITSPGIITGIPGGHGQALSAEIFPREFSTEIISVSDNIASRGLNFISGSSKKIFF